MQAAVDGLRADKARIADLLGEALQIVKPVFRETIWPARCELVEGAMSTLQEYFVPCFAAMARRQSAILDLVLPERIDAFLVPDCYDRRGGYSHPLTIDVSHNRGLELCETLLHEVTHVGDVYTQSLGHDSLRDRLAVFFLSQGVSEEQAWNDWHAVIFAASADQVRRFIAPAYVDYAKTLNVFASFGMSELPSSWCAFANGAYDEPALFEAIARQMADREGLVP